MKYSIIIYFECNHVPIEIKREADDSDEMYRHFFNLRDDWHECIGNKEHFQPTDDLCINYEKILYMELIKS